MADELGPDFDGMSLADVGLALKTASSYPEERASSVGGKLRFAAQRPRAGVSLFRSRFGPQRLKYRSRWRQEGLDLARPNGRRRHLTSTLKKPA